MVNQASAVLVLCLLTTGSMVHASEVSGASEPSLKESIRLKLEADRESIYSMSRSERHAYISALLQAPTREERRAAKYALQQVRGEWGITDQGDKPVRRSTTRGETAALVGGTSITYDTGTVTGTAGVDMQMLGNRFDSALNPAGTACCFPVETTGSITMVTFDLVNTFFSAGIVSIYSNVMGTTAVQVTSRSKTVGTGLNTLTIGSGTTANAYMNGTFLAGIWQGTLGSTALAVDTGTVGGQGFHAISLNDGTTGIGSMLTTVTSGGMGLYAVFRVQGDVATPVELMGFTIE